MAENIVSSLFGLSRQQVQQQQLMQDRAMNQQEALIQPRGFGEAYLANANAASGLVRGVAGLFGLQSPEEQRASAMDEALKVAMGSLSPEQRNNRGAVMGRVSEVLASNPNFQREALQAQMQGAAFAREDNENNINNAYKQSLTARQNIEVEQEKMDRRGSIAYGASKALQKATSNESKQKVWKNVITSLADEGTNISSLVQLPESEWLSTLESITESSYTGKERLAQDKLQAEFIYRDAEQKRKERKDQDLLIIANKRDDLRWQISQAQIGGANQRSVKNLEAQEKALTNSFEKMREAFKFDTRKAAVNKVGFAESNNSVRNYISENYDIDTKEANKNVEVANGYIRAALNATNKDGSFKYPDESLAFEEAMSQFAKDRIGVEEGFFKDKNVITKQSPKKSNYSTKEQDWINRAKAKNPNESEENIISQGKKLGKVK